MRTYIYVLLLHSSTSPTLHLFGTCVCSSYENRSSYYYLHIHTYIRSYIHTRTPYACGIPERASQATKQPSQASPSSPPPDDCPSAPVEPHTSCCPACPTLSIIFYYSAHLKSTSRQARLID
ncbi:hypothetical protein F5B20DRAFT_516307 [Whalleya microplaca]|nr:hypothetical protein F5B20DRAFT_516307 [Whalleya microplaca]